MIKIQNGIATREPLPDFLVGLAPESLADLSWTDPALGVQDCAWWPGVVTTPEFDTHTHKLGTETRTPDFEMKVVNVTYAVEPLTPEEIPAPPVIKHQITRLAFRNRFTQSEKVALEIAALDNPSATMAERTRAAGLRVSLADTAAAAFIDLARPDTRAGVEMLETSGLLAPGRAAQILDAPIDDTERPQP